MHCTAMVFRQINPTFISVFEFAETELEESDDEDKLAKRIYENSEPMTLLELLKHPKERSYAGRVNEPHPHILTK